MVLVRIVVYCQVFYKARLNKALKKEFGEKVGDCIGVTSIILSKVTEGKEEERPFATIFYNEDAVVVNGSITEIITLVCGILKKIGIEALLLKTETII